jgi:hypothetical protein
MVTDDGAGDAMELDDVVKEDFDDGDRGVQVARWDEVGVLEEAVDHDQIRTTDMPPTREKHSMNSIAMSAHTIVGSSRGCSNPTGWRCSDLLCSLIAHR